MITFRLASVGEERPQGRFRFLTNYDVDMRFYLAGWYAKPEKWHSLKNLDDMKVRISVPISDSSFSSAIEDSDSASDNSDESVRSSKNGTSLKSKKSDILDKLPDQISICVELRILDHAEF